MTEFIQRIVGSEVVTIDTDCTQAEAAERLCANIHTDLRKVSKGTSAFGKVTTDNVRFALYRPHLPSAFRWCFEGVIAEREGGASLQGKLKLSRYSQVFLGVWVAFTVLVGALSATGALANAFAATLTGSVSSGIHAHAFFVMLAFGGSALIIPGLLRVPKDIVELRAVADKSLQAVPSA